MTKFILIGGYPYKAKDGGKSMCQEAVDGIKNPVKILLCLYARPKDEWPELFEKNKDFFERNLPNRKLIFTTANENELVSQIKDADILNINGGDTTDLIAGLKKNPGWQNALTNKVVMGSSAGCDILSKYNYDIETFKCTRIEGSGLVPVKTIVHFESEEYKLPISWQEAVQKLKDFKENLPIWLLREGEYKVYES